MYQLRQTVFDKLESFNIQYTDDQKLFNALTVFDLESICIPEEKIKNTETTTWIGKHVPISVSISLNLIVLPIFPCKSNPRDLVEFSLATQSKAQMKLKFLEVETAIKSNLTRALESLNERRCRKQRVFEFEYHCLEDDNQEKNASTQFLQMQKNQLIELQENLERYCNVLPVFGFNSTKYDINLTKSYLLPILINQRIMEPFVIEKAIQFVSFKIGDLQLLDIMQIPGGATSLDSFPKAYKTSKTKGFFPHEKFDCPQSVNKSELPPYDAFFSKCLNVNPLEKDYSDSNRFKPQQNKSRKFENMVMVIFQRQRPDCKIESFYTTGTQKRIDCLKADGFCAHCKSVFKAMCCFYIYCLCQEARFFLTKEDIERGNKKR